MENPNIDRIKALNQERILAIERQNRYPYHVDMNEPIDMDRCKVDFLYWAARCVTIRDKLTGRNVPFLLNRAQRFVLDKLEQMRNDSQPIRIILLKARQWGGSTLIQTYMAWIQMVHRRNWHSVICAHVGDAARNIRAMYSTMLANYPDEACETEKKPAFVGFEKALNVKLIKERQCRVTIASAENQESVRGSDIAMAHLSEVAFWKSTTRRDPEDFLRAVCSSVPLVPYSLVAIESTPNGVGNFFHREWLRAEAGTSDKKAVFVPWFMIDINSMDIDDDDIEAFWESMTPYERTLWDVHHCTLQQIKWYRRKLSEFPKAELMHAEFPTSPEEAFVSSDANVFANKDVERLRKHCRQPRRGVLNERGGFIDDPRGCLSVWSEPQADADYIVTVDVGGRSAKSDWSVIAVIKGGDIPEVVAQWRGHLDHDLLGKEAIRVAQWYGEALLVIESNMLETADDSTVASMVLSYVATHYHAVYRRRRRLPGIDGATGIGFHTNRQTKSLVINSLIAAVREGSYTERDDEACNELSTYCRRENGAYEAGRGCHDDILMTRAIALYLLREEHCLPDSGWEDRTEALPPIPVW